MMPSERPLRVMQLITTLDVGGAEAMLAKLAAGLDRSRFTPLVVSLLPPGPMADPLQDAGVRVESLFMRRGLPTPGALLRLVRIMRRFRPRVVHTWLYHADLIGLVAARFAGSPPVMWNIRCAEMDLAGYARTTAWTLKLLARLSARPAAVVANSEVGARFHEGLGYRQRIRVVPNGFDTARFRPDPAARAALRAELGLAEDTLLAGYVGRFDHMKDIPNCVGAFKVAAAAVPGARFVFCGQGLGPTDQEIGRLVDEAGIGARTSLLGVRRDVPRVMAGLDALALSSRAEGFPNVIGEAMSCGVPCAATRAGDTAEVVGETGELAPTEDPRALGGALARLLALPAAERARLGRAARERIGARYSLEAVAERYQDLYDEIARKRPPAAAAPLPA